MGLSIPAQNQILNRGSGTAGSSTMTTQVTAGLPFHGKHPFPEGLPHFRNDVLKWLAEMERIGGLLSMALADSLGLGRHFFVDGMCRDHLGTLGLMHYPPQREINEAEWGVGTHSDYGFLTLLMFDEPRL